MSALGATGTARLFQFTPLREGRQSEVARNDAVPQISIHAPPRGATAAVKYAARVPDISIHAPPRGATQATVESSVNLCISIHAPPRGATFPTPGLSDTGKISIHAPPRGATETARQPGHSGGYFNSRPSARGDSTATKSAATPPISIHAPPRGATRVVSCHSVANPIAISIHAPPRGATRLPPAPLRLEHFNSRPSARGDRILVLRVFHIADFNSRPSARGDQPPLKRQILVVISIHAPPRGATFANQRPRLAPLL